MVESVPPQKDDQDAADASALTPARDQHATGLPTRSPAHLRDDLLAAAERESREIVNAARADVRRVLVKARRDLIVLAAQVQAATGAGSHNERGASRLSAAPETLLLAAQQSGGVLHEALPDLESLASEVGALGDDIQQTQTIPLALPAKDKGSAETSVYEDPAAAARALQARLASAPERRADPRDRSPRRRSRTAAMVALAVVVALTAGGYFWLRPARSTNVQRTNPQPAPRSSGTQPGAAAKPPATTIPSPAPKPSGLTILVQARRESWIRVAVDGRIATERLFKAGDTHSVTKAKEVTIRAGDAGAVFVSVNGAPPTALGRDGQVVTRRFPLDEPPPRTGSSEIPSASPQTAIVAPPALGSAAATAASGSADADVVRPELVGAAQRWLDAYHAKDGTRLAALSSARVKVVDERQDAERLPPGLPGVRRTLDDAKVQVFGADAILTARMTEQTVEPSGLPGRRSVAFISQMWTRRNGVWQLDDVKIVSAAAVDKAFRR